MQIPMLSKRVVFLFELPRSPTVACIRTAVPVRSTFLETRFLPITIRHQCKLRTFLYADL